MLSAHFSAQSSVAAFESNEIALGDFGFSMAATHTWCVQDGGFAMSLQ